MTVELAGKDRRARRRLPVWAAIDITVAYAEERVFRSRLGAGGIVDEDVDGIVAASFTHWAVGPGRAV